MNLPDFDPDNIDLSFDLSEEWDLPDWADGSDEPFDNGIDYVEEIVRWQKDNPDRCARCGEIEPPIKHSAFEEQVQLCEKCLTFERVGREIFGMKEPPHRGSLNRELWDREKWIALGGSADGE